MSILNVFLPSSYTYKQPVPGSASLHICRPLDHYVLIPVRFSSDHPEGEPEFVVPCHKETKQVHGPHLYSAIMQIVLQC